MHTIMEMLKIVLISCIIFYKLFLFSQISGFSLAWEAIFLRCDYGRHFLLILLPVTSFSQLKP